MNSKHSVMLLALACWAGGAGAAQPREVRDGETMEAAIAADAPTRVRLEGQRIVNVVGNIHSASNCDSAPPAGAASPATVPLAAPAVNPRGDVILNCDLDKGEIYVRPAATGHVGQVRPISLFVSSPRATYTLLLRPAQMPADSLVLRDRRSESSEPAAKATRPQATSHVRGLKSMLVSMAQGRPADGVRAQQLDVVQALWREAEFRLIRRQEGRTLQGETYRLRNTSAAPMVLAEQEFDQDGVLAVAIEQHNLPPGATTLVHVIRQQEGTP